MKIRLLMVMVFLLPSAYAEPVRDVGILVLEDTFDANTTYDDFLRIENFDHKTGQTDSLDINVSYTVHNYSFQTEKTINKYSTSGMGVLNLSEGIYELCGNITPLNFEDDYMQNNTVCETFYVGNVTVEETNESNTSSSVCTDFSVSVNRSYRVGESASISFDYEEDDTGFVRNVTYWVQDMTGEVVKNKLNTTNPSEKSFTPSFDGLEKSYTVLGSVPACNMSSSSLMTFYNPGFEGKDEEIQVEVEDVDTHVKLRFSGYKGGSEKEVLRVYLEQDGERITTMQKVYLRQNEMTFDFETTHFFDVDTGEYDLVVRGIGIERRFDVSIERDVEEVVKEKPVEPEFISSFYTLKETFDQNISVFHNVKDVEDVKIYTSNGVYDAGDERTEIGIQREDEVIVMEAVNDSIRDLAYIQLDLEREREEAPPTRKEQNSSLAQEDIDTKAEDSTPINISLPPQPEPQERPWIYDFCFEISVLVLVTLVLYSREIRYIGEDVKNYLKQ